MIKQSDLESPHPERSCSLRRLAVRGMPSILAPCQDMREGIWRQGLLKSVLHDRRNLRDSQ
jgi:hypothetical protein